ncbi:MAG: hypothetical protein LCH92_08360 [Proteobacteria bacterium]|nr:hypothetical protein [Pseudomonadota bacterium]
MTADLSNEALDVLTKRLGAKADLEMKYGGDDSLYREAKDTITALCAENGVLIDKLELERALTDGAHRRALTVEAAKAAAQADYEHRILASLEPNPAAHADDALAAVRREARAEGMRKAADIAAAKWGSLGGACDAIAGAILAAAEKEASHG